MASVDELKNDLMNLFHKYREEQQQLFRSREMELLERERVVALKERDLTELATYRHVLRQHLRSIQSSLESINKRIKDCQEIEKQQRKQSQQELHTLLNAIVNWVSSRDVSTVILMNCPCPLGYSPGSLE